MADWSSRSLSGALGWSIGAVAARLRGGGDDMPGDADWLRTMMRSCTDGVLVTDAGGRIEAMNGVAERLTGWPARDATGTHASTIVPLVEEGTGAPLETLPTATPSAAGASMVASLMARGGQVHPVNVSVVAVRGRDGVGRGYLVVLRDLTERRAAEAQREQEMCEFLARANLPFSTIGPDGLILRANQAELDLYGYARETYVGRHVALFHEDERSVLDMLRRIRAGEPLRQHPSRVRCLDGTVKPVLISADIAWRDGRVVHARCLTRDPTEARRGDHEQRSLSALVDASSDAMFGASLDGRVVTWTHGARELLGYSQEEAVGKPAGALVPHEERSSHEGRVARVARGERIEQCPAVFVARDGQKIDVWLTLAPIRDEAGGITGIAAVVRDTRREKALQDALYSADRRQSECLTVLAHELRNPLAAIWYSATSVQRAGASEDDRRWGAEVIERQSKHMARLIDDLLDASQMSRHSLELRCADVALQTVIDLALENSRPLVAANEQTVTTTIPAETIVVHADLARLAQALSNIVNNASKCSPRGSHIRLTVTREEAEVVIAVEDEGIGIASERLPEIFEMFSPMTHGFDRAPGGLGIGLSLAKGLTELHGGRVTASSPGFGRGSSFEIRLPAVRSSFSASVPGPGTARADLVCRRILIADDNRDAADGLARVLRGIGHDVCTAYDGVEALEAVEQFRPEVVLLDLGMPRVDGFEAARKLRAGPRGDGILVIALSGWGQGRERQQTRAAGFDAHFVKPLDPSLLQALLQTRG